MTTIIDTIIQEQIDTPLRSIAGVSVLPGYMVHYANDLMDQYSDVRFPCVSFQPVSDSTTSQAGAKKLKNSRIMRVIAAVDIINRATVNSKLNALLFDIRKALIVNNSVNPTALTTLIFGDAVFKLPDSQDQYAFFELDITINYVEVLNQ